MVANALRAMGVTVELMADHFPQDTADAVWLEEVGNRGWVVLTKDKNITHNHIEIVALLKSNTHSFVLTSGSITGAEMAHAFVVALPQIRGIVETTKAPLVATVSRGGNVRVTHTYAELQSSLEAASRRESLPNSSAPAQKLPSD